MSPRMAIGSGRCAFGVRRWGYVGEGCVPDQRLPETSHGRSGTAEYGVGAGSGSVLTVGRTVFEKWIRNYRCTVCREITIRGGSHCMER